MISWTISANDYSNRVPITAISSRIIPYQNLLLMIVDQLQPATSFSWHPCTSVVHYGSEASSNRYSICLGIKFGSLLITLHILLLYHIIILTCITYMDKELLYQSNITQCTYLARFSWEARGEAYLNTVHFIHSGK